MFYKASFNGAFFCAEKRIKSSLQFELKNIPLQPEKHRCIKVFFNTVSNLNS